MSRTRSMLLSLAGGVVGAVVGARAVALGGRAIFEARVLASPMAICLYAWIVVSAYWALAARKASAARSAEPEGSRTLHLSLIGAAQLVAFWPYAGWPAMVALVPAFPTVIPPLPWAGVGVALGGMLLAIWARVTLGRNWSGEVSAKIDHELVQWGPYRRVRHPIYTGAIAMYLGPALVSGRLSGVVSLALVAIAYARKIGQEERLLRAEFGDAWDAYRRRSRALVPWIL
jgi:protein-S-isoprenylcysteine O-methyltransferase Ste14